MILLVAKNYESKADLQVDKPAASYFYQMSSSQPMTELNNALDRILVYLEEHEDLDNARFESLQIGLSYKEIIEKTKDLPFCLPNLFYYLLLLHDSFRFVLPFSLDQLRK